MAENHENENVKPKTTRKKVTTTAKTTTQKKKVENTENKTSKTPIRKTSSTKKKTETSKKSATKSKTDSKQSTKTSKNTEKTTGKTTVKKSVKTTEKNTINEEKKNKQSRNKRITEVVNIVEENEKEKVIKKKKEEVIDIDTKLKAIEEERKRRKYIPEKEKRIMLLGAFGNIFLACFVTLVLIIMNLSFKFATNEVLENVLKTSTFGSLLITIILFENAYKKDNDTIAIYGIEMLIFSIFNLASVYLAIIKPHEFSILMSTTAIIFEIYYVVKAGCAFYYRKNKYYKDTNEMKKIIRKNINYEDIEELGE